MKEIAGKLHEFLGQFVTKDPLFANDPKINVFILMLIFIAMSVMCIYLISRSQKVMHYVAEGKQTILGVTIITILLGIAIMFASEFAPKVSNARVNVRDSIAIFAAIVGGPIAGIIVGILGGIYRAYLGGWTAIGCATATVLAGIVASGIVYFTKFKPKNINAKTITLWSIFAMLWEAVVHLGILVPLLAIGKTFEQGFIAMAKDFMLPMSVMNAIAAATFLLLIKDMVLNDSRIALDEQNKLIAEVEDLRMKVFEKEEAEKAGTAK